jgi:hypothetical protein
MPTKTKNPAAPFTVWFPRGDLGALREIRARTGVPVATLVRQAVRMSLAALDRAATAFECPPRRGRSARKGTP